MSSFPTSTGRQAVPHTSCRLDGTWVYRVSLTGTHWYRCTGCDVEAPSSAVLAPAVLDPSRRVAA